MSEFRHESTLKEKRATSLQDEQKLRKIQSFKRLSKQTLKSEGLRRRTILAANRKSERSMIWINMDDAYNRRILSIFNAPRGLPDLQLVVQIAIILQQELNDIKKLLLKFYSAVTIYQNYKTKIFW